MLGLPNPYVMLGALGLVIGAFFYGSHVGKAETLAKQVSNELLIAKAAEASQQAAAKEISKIQVVNKTIQGKVETITRENTIYRDCHNSSSALRLLNGALSGQPWTEPTGSGVVPVPVPAH